MNSPLWMVSQAPHLNALVVALQKHRESIDSKTGGEKLHFSRTEVARARAEFSDMIRRGERDLHLLASLLAERLLGSVQRKSVVIGEIERTRERFTLMVDVTEDEVIGTTDIDLGNRVLARLAIADQRGWLRASLISNVVEYEADAPNPHSVYRLLTRIKAEEEIWNKVADEIFELDRLVLRDKQLRHLGKYVKDVFGVKIVVGTSAEAESLQATLHSLRFDDERLAARKIPLDAEHRALQFLEVKNYLETESRKRSGWSAMKSVVAWGGRTFEVQVQPLSNFLHERERLTRESHASFKSTRERIRDEIAARMPLFFFYRALLRWLFVDPSEAPPIHEGVEVILSE
ncbi:MAG: hypothetical protein JNM17_16690 [Archangium sp.]|nr:hypothetical protein [Archangium sp.]